ncbi:YdbC family protein [Ectobacillus funiculus]
MDERMKSAEVQEMAEIKFEIQEKVWYVVRRIKGMEKKEFTLISWNGREPKYDIRDWSEDHGKMGKGVTLSKSELIQLKKLLNEMDL